MKRRQAGIALATLVAVLITSTSFAQPQSKAKTASVKCVGANNCKGHSACQTASNGCKGQNNCKGQGYIMTHTKKECLNKGGKIGD